MSPDQKETLRQIVDRLYAEIEQMHEITCAIGDKPVQTSADIDEYRALRDARLSLRAAAAKIDEVLYDAHTRENYSPHERKTCQACAHGCCAMTSDFA